MTNATAPSITRDLDGVQAPAPGTWNLDPGHTRVGFVARHLMVTKVRGDFERFSGTVQIGERIEDSSVEVAIETASITTGNEQRDTHLRTNDFLEVETYPTITFRSTGVERTGPTTLAITGELTIKDVSRTVVLDAEYEGTSTAPWGSVVTGFAARTEINREDFGIVWNASLETGGVLVGPKIVIELDVQAAKA